MKKGIFFWLITILMIIYFILGFIGIIIPSSGFLWTIENDETANIAINQVDGYIMIATSLTYFVFLGACPRCRFSKKLRSIFILLGILVPVIMDIAYFGIFNNQLSIISNTHETDFIYATLGDSITLTIGLFVGQITLIAAGIYAFFYDSKSYIPATIFVIFFVATILINVAVGLAITAAVIAIVYIILMLIVRVLYNQSPHTVYTLTDDMGQTRILTFYEYYTTGNDYYERYKDDVGNFWIKDKYSDKFYPE